MSVTSPTSNLVWRDPDSLLAGDCRLDRTGPVESVTAPSVVSTDADLLRDFITAGTGTSAAQIALTRIVERHGTLVYQVAMRMVGDRSLADDVFQATFLVLAQSARKIQRTSSLASWLHGTARNVGRRALAQKHALRSGTEAGVAMVTSAEDDPFSEMIRTHERQLLDEELLRLPEFHREPLVLHYLEERSLKEISQLLGITVAAVESRLKRAKQELRAKLVRRGITLSVALAALGAATSVASAAPPAALVSSTITLAATTTAVGTSLTAGTTSTAIQLAGKELAAMSAASKATALVVGAAGTLTVGGAVLFGAVLGGYSGSGAGPGIEGQGPSAILGIDQGLGSSEDEMSLLLAQAEEKASGTSDPVEQGLGVTNPDEGATAPPKDNEDKESSDDAAPAAEDDKDGDDDAPATEDKEEPADRDDADSPEEADTDDDAMEKPSEDGESHQDGEPADEDHDGEESKPVVTSFRRLSPGEQRIYSVLDQKITLEFPDNTLPELIGFVAESTQIPIQLDRTTLTDAGITDDARINIVLDGISLKSSLSLVLENVNGVELGYYVDGDMLFITTAEKMNDKVKLRFYDLSGGIENLSQAVELYAKQLDRGEDRLSVTSLGDCLAIRTTLGQHKEIEEFITGALELAAAREAEGKELPVVPPTPMTTPSTSPSDQTTPESGTSRIEKKNSPTVPKIARFRELDSMDINVYRAMDENIELTCDGLTLLQFAEYLSDCARIPVRIDEVSLDQEAKHAESIKVNYSGTNTLAHSLQIICETSVTGVRLDYYVDRGVLFLTSHVGIDRSRERYYNLSGGNEDLTLGQRVMVYLKSADPEQITEMSALGNDRFAITTSLQVHKKLEGFLVETVD